MSSKFQGFFILGVKAQNCLATEMLIQSASNQQITMPQSQALISRTQFQRTRRAGTIKNHPHLPIRCRASFLCITCTK